jgi:hypothetical protein
MVREMQPYDPLTESEKIEQLVRPLAYQPDKDVEILTEKYNIAPVMSPGEVDALVDGVIRDFEQCPENDQELIAQYKIMLQDFARTGERFGSSTAIRPRGGRYTDRQLIVCFGN